MSYFSISSLSLTITPTALKLNKWQDPYAQATLVLMYIFCTIEIIDLILQTISRYIQFGGIDKKNLLRLTKIKFGFKHKYILQIQNKNIFWLILFGTNY